MIYRPHGSSLIVCLKLDAEFCVGGLLHRSHEVCARYNLYYGRVHARGLSLVIPRV